MVRILMRAAVLLLSTLLVFTAGHDAALADHSADEQAVAVMAFQSDDAEDNNGEPLVRQDAQTETDSSTLIWAGVIGLAIGITFSVMRAKRKQRR